MTLKEWNKDEMSPKLLKMLGEQNAFIKRMVENINKDDNYHIKSARKFHQMEIGLKRQLEREGFRWPGWTFENHPDVWKMVCRCRTKHS